MDNMEKSQDSEVKLVAGNLSLERIDEDHVVVVEIERKRSSGGEPKGIHAENDGASFQETELNERSRATRDTASSDDEGAGTLGQIENNDNEVSIPHMQPFISEVTEDVSVASMSSFSVLSQWNMRPGIYHESLIHSPDSETPRVMFIPTPTIPGTRGIQSSGMDVSEGSTATISTPSWTIPQHPSILESDMEGEVIIATLVEPDDRSEDHENINQEISEIEVDEASVHALVVGTALEAKQSHWQQKKLHTSLIS